MPVVPVADVMAQLTAMGLVDHEDKVAETLLDAGCEDTVPLNQIVKYLRDAGVPAARALALKTALSTRSLPAQTGAAPVAVASPLPAAPPTPPTVSFHCSARVCLLSFTLSAASAGCCTTGT